MFFGMANSPATFQTMMNDIFRTLIAEGIVVVYLDDILIFTETEEEHEQAVRRVLEVLAELSQTSFGHIFTNSSTIPTVSKRA